MLFYRRQCLVDGWFGETGTLIAVTASGRR